MDPLSVTAGILTVLSAAGAVKENLEKLKSRMNPDLEFLTLMNTVTDVQQTLILARECADVIKKSKAPAAQRSYRDLPGSTNRLQAAVDELAEFIWSTLLRKGKGLSRLSLNENKKNRLSELRGLISEAHQNLQFILQSANIFQGPILLAAIEEAVIEESNHHVKTSAQLEYIISQITSLQNLNEEKWKCQTPSNRENERSVGLDESAQSRDLLNKAIPPAMDQHVRITVSLPSKTCKPSCHCQCHVRKQFQTPRWLLSVVGLLFYSASETPTLKIRPCDSASCFRSLPSSSTRLIYYFPTWIMRSVLICSTSRNLDGRNASWSIKMPREVSLFQSSWHHIQHGHTEKIRDLLYEGLMSPYDIDTDGVSMLHWAEHHRQWDICSILTAAGADWNFKDRLGRSPADAAWKGILTEGLNDPDSVRLRSLLGPNDSTDLDLTLLHRTVIGICFVDVRDQLEREPSQANNRDWTGMTPLMWAAFLANDVVLRLLLSYAANAHLVDRDGKTALHYAARAGSLECVNLLLIAGVDPSSVDNNGRTPLHDLMVLGLEQDLSKEIVSMLKDYRADLDAQDNRGWSPLGVAVDMGNPAGIEALATFGADINALSYHGLPALGLAINDCQYACLETLCRLGANIYWPSELHKVENVFKPVALYGTVESMRILTSSNVPRLDYDPQEIGFWFTSYRHEQQIYGERFSEEVELAAFQDLLAAKGNPVRKTQDSVAATGYAADTCSQETLSQDPINEEGCQSDLFFDAVEDLSAYDGMESAQPLGNPIGLSA